jgi:hypothetical protein
LEWIFARNSESNEQLRQIFTINRNASGQFILSSNSYPHNLTDLVYSGYLSAHNKKGRSK